MKPLQTIIDEVLKKLPESTEEYSSTDLGFKVYTTFSGRLDGCYFRLYFMQGITEEIIIEVAHTTENPQQFVDMIKAIEPKAKVAYHQTTTKRITV